MLSYGYWAAVSISKGLNLGRGSACVFTDSLSDPPAQCRGKRMTDRPSPDEGTTDFATAQARTRTREHHTAASSHPAPISLTPLLNKSTLRSSDRYGQDRQPALQVSISKGLNLGRGSACVFTDSLSDPPAQCRGKRMTDRPSPDEGTTDLPPHKPEPAQESTTPPLPATLHLSHSPHC
ncbi:hypothetical protein G5714_011490 [Onychostoma macrolepis]|uniref:Uncharacterized protein n=1 Tax=Onychostoma macrolepis TaxID=369639 RepID=A0A7J6CJ07_9TELE|nr:hypothetical protein G5714_011490 [Onychostoma macrolepis]